jgi:hypothetical protein
MEEQICFIVMGFGKKKDPDTNRTIDLDATYKKIIRPAVESAGCKCIRADEIVESGIIDRSMYALLYYADIVIADISTFNPNAIYELGVRHALRPYSTIIIKEDEGKIPFDIGHDRIISYKHLGNEISEAEVRKCIPQLRTLIQNVINEPKTDSPLYSYIHQIKKPEISEEEISSIIGELKNNEDSIYALTEMAKENMAKSDFVKAEQLWEKLCYKAENEKYYIQQRALCRYKSEVPTTQKALTDALLIMAKIEGQTDTETLGILGAINKRLYEITSDKSFLTSAIDSYKRAWNQYKDYYTGENYATCMFMKSKIETSEELKTHSSVEAKLTYTEIIDIILKSLEDKEVEELLWKYASLSNAYLALDDHTNAEKYEKLFYDQQPQQWEKKTFEKTKETILNLLLGDLE